jgi:hypothetical protein
LSTGAKTRVVGKGIRKGYKHSAAVDRQKNRLDILLTEYSFGCILWNVSWSVEFTDEFGQWWVGLSEDQQDDVAYSVSLLAELGPSLGFPHSSKVTSSRHSSMRELRTQSGGKPLRTLYIFDPYRTAILLIGGDKTGNDRWYEQFVPAADRIYQQYLEEIRKEDSGREREHFEKTGQEFGAVCERLRWIEERALAELRSPERARHLRALLVARGGL